MTDCHITKCSFDHERVESSVLVNCLFPKRIASRLDALAELYFYLHSSLPFLQQNRPVCVTVISNMYVLLNRNDYEHETSTPIDYV